MNLDLAIYHFFNNFVYKDGFLDHLIVFFGEWFPYLVILLSLIILVLYTSKTFKERVTIGVIGIGTLVISRVIVELVRIIYPRVRPFEALGGNHLLTSSSASFPSGHATAFFCLAMLVYLENKTWGIIFFIFAILISLARVSAGLHFPSDILGGAVLGILTAWFIKKFTDKKKTI